METLVFSYEYRFIMTVIPNWSTHGVSGRQTMNSPLCFLAVNMRMRILEFYHLTWLFFFCFSKVCLEKKEQGWCLNFSRISRYLCFLWVFFFVSFWFFFLVGWFFWLITVFYSTLKLKYFLFKKKKWLITPNTVNICYLSSITVLFEAYKEIWFLSSWKAQSFYI